MNAVTLCRISDAIGDEIAISSPRRGMELTMAIADWIREHTARQRVKFEAQMRQEAYERRERLAMQAFIEGYLKGYDDSAEGRERRFPVDALDDPYKKYKID